MSTRLFCAIACFLVSINAQALSFITVGDSISVGVVKRHAYVYCPTTGQEFTDTGAAFCIGGGALNKGGFQPFLAHSLGANVYNYGISGHFAEQTFQVSRFASRASGDYLIIWVGVVDVLKGTPFNQIIATLNAIAEDGRNNGKIPLILTLAPLDGSFYHSFNDELIELNELIKEQAQATVIDVYSVLAPDWPQMHSGDRVHLNDLGNQRVAQKIAEDYLNPYPPKPDTAFMSALEILLLD